MTYDPGEPRDAHGRWTDGTASEYQHAGVKLYHGTARAADIRRKGFEEKVGGGIYLSTHPAVAQQYADSHAKYDEALIVRRGEVLPASLTPGTRIADLRGGDDIVKWQKLGRDPLYSEADRAHIETLHARGYPLYVELKDRGYHGLIQDDTLGHTHASEVIVFHPSRIKLGA